MSGREVQSVNVVKKKGDILGNYPVTSDCSFTSDSTIVAENPCITLQRMCFRMLTLYTVSLLFYYLY